MPRPTYLEQRTVKALREDGWLVEKTQYRVYLHTTRDLFGLFDHLAVKPPKTLAVQTTSYSNIAAHRKKLDAQQATLRKLLACGWVMELWGWRKKGARFEPPYVYRAKRMYRSAEVCFVRVKGSVANGEA